MAPRVQERRERGNLELRDSPKNQNRRQRLVHPTSTWRDANIIAPSERTTRPHGRPGRRGLRQSSEWPKGTGWRATPRGNSLAGPTDPASRPGADRECSKRLEGGERELDGPDEFFLHEATTHLHLPEVLQKHGPLVIKELGVIGRGVRNHPKTPNRGSHARTGDRGEPRLWRLDRLHQVVQKVGQRPDWFLGLPAAGSSRGWHPWGRSCRCCCRR